MAQITAVYAFPFPKCSNSILFCQFLMKFIPVFVLFGWLPVFGVGQQYSYWQQHVNHTIDVTLDDRNHILHGRQIIEYTNHSPDTLRFIFFQLYGNAYSSRTTEFAKEQLRHGSDQFQKAEPDQLGRVDSLAFFAEGRQLNLDFDIHPDYAKVILASPLLPGSRIELVNIFRYKLNYTFSRGGHVGQSYQISQWYPKPSVYDKDGWHPLVYLNYGEYYAEYGNYNVSITLPVEYLVGSTGVLQNREELDWLKAQADAYAENLNKSARIPHPRQQNGTEQNNNASPTKTLLYKASNVPDFAWFADKRFYVLKSVVQLPRTGRSVDTWAFFHSEERKELWRKVPGYIDSSLFYYSSWIGDYEYDQATAVEGALVAGGGMEYPQVTIIGDMNSPRSLHAVIAHEVGHNWFQTMIGSNERAHPWMDEGINSYYEKRYMSTVNLPPVGVPGMVEKLLGVHKINEALKTQLPYLFQARRHYEQPACSHSTALTPTNLGIMVYMKVPIAFDYLESYMGRGALDSVMSLYFNRFLFRHPQPEDLRRLFDSTGYELDWLFDELLCTSGILDYKFTGISDTTHIGTSTYYRLKVKNKGDVKGPLSITSYQKNGNPIHTLRFGGFLGKNHLLFPYSNDVAAFRIDGEERMPEYRRQDNTIRTSGLLKTVEPIRFKLCTSIEDPYKTVVHFLPMVGFNLYDGLMTGLAFHNIRVPLHNTQWSLIPMYSVKRGTLTGLGRVETFIYPKGLQHLKVMALASSFAMDSFKTKNGVFYRHFIKFSSQLELRLKTSSFDRWSLLSIKGFHIQNNVLKYVGDQNFGKYFISRHAIQIEYLYANKRTFNPYYINLESQWLNEGNQHSGLRILASFSQTISYSKNKGFDFRIFTGLSSNNIPPLTTGASPGYHDLTYSHYFIGRNEFNGFASHQVLLNQGGLKFVSPPFVYGNFGQSKFVAAVNLKSSLPLRWFFVFADFATHANDAGFPYESIQYDAGVGIKVIKDVAEVYFPLLFSQEIRTQVINPYYSKWYQRILFTLALENLDPAQLIRRVRF